MNYLKEGFRLRRSRLVAFLFLVSVAASVMITLITFAAGLAGYVKFNDFLILALYWLMSYLLYESVKSIINNRTSLALFVEIIIVIALIFLGGSL